MHRRGRTDDAGSPEHSALDLGSVAIEKGSVDADGLVGDRIRHQPNDGSDLGVPAQGMLKIEQSHFESHRPQGVSNYFCSWFPDGA
jgi:hypothetical protein